MNSLNTFLFRHLIITLSITIGGRAVKVGRLSNIGQAQHFIQQFAQEAAKYNRVYISNIHSNIQDDDIRAVFESFGEVIR